MASNNSNTSNSSETNLGENNNSIDIFVFVLGAVFALSGLIILNTLFTNLNRIMKTILNILFVHTLFVYYTLVVILSSGGRDVFTCSFMTFLTMSLCFIVFDHLAVISCVRFYLVRKSAQNERPNERLVIALVSLVYLFDYVIHILLTTLTDTTYEELCLNERSTSTRDQTEYVIRVIIAVFVIILSLYYDNKYIGFLRTNALQESDLTIPVRASWVALATWSIWILISAIFAPKGREHMFTAANIIGFLVTFLILMTYLVLIYQERKKASQQGEGQACSGEDPQSYTHLREVSKEKLRVKRNSVTENNITQQLQNVSNILTFDQIMEHTTAQTPQAFDINEVTSAKKTAKLNRTDKDLKKKSKTNKIAVKIDRELSCISGSRSQSQPNPLEYKNIQANQENHDHGDSQEGTPISLNDQAIDDELIEQEMVHFNLSRKVEPRQTSDSIDILDQMINEEMSYYNLTHKKSHGEAKYNSWDSESVDQKNEPQQEVILNP